MNANTTVMGIILAVVIVLFIGYEVTRRYRSKAVVHRVIVRFARGIQTKLILNDEQYEQFKAWLNQPDGIYEIGDDSNMAWLDRPNVVSVEHKMVRG